MIEIFFTIKYGYRISKSLKKVKEVIREVGNSKSPSGKEFHIKTIPYC